MAERKFTRGLSKPGSAAQVRETVSQVVRQSTVLSKPQLVEPIDYETFIAKNKTALHNDPQRELLLYPPDDVSQSTTPRRYRTLVPVDPSRNGQQITNRCVLQSIKTYTSCWCMIHYKYNAYSSSNMQLSRLSRPDNLEEQVFEVDATPNPKEDEVDFKGVEVTKEGYLLKGPESRNDTFITSMATKSFKRRYVYLKREVDGTYVLEFHKDDRKKDPKFTICMEFCNEVVQNVKRGKFSFELRMQEGHKSYALAAESENELEDWLAKLTQVVHNSKLEENNSKIINDFKESPCATPDRLGTLKGLEHSRNPELIKFAKETDHLIAINRKENRHNVFAVYPELTKISEAVTEVDDLEAEPYREQFGTRIIVRCDEVKFELQVPSETDRRQLCQIEPYTTFMALYNAKTGKKISEDFRFDVNHPSTRTAFANLRIEGEANGKNDEVNGNGRSACPANLSGLSDEWLAYPNQAIFNVSHPDPEIYLVVRIEKVLQGSISQAVEPYMRTSRNVDIRASMKVQRTVRACCQRLGKYNMPFAWAAKPIFKPYSGHLDAVSENINIFKEDASRLSDDDLLKSLAEWRKSDKKHKLTHIPGAVRITIEPFDKLVSNCLTSSMVPLRPFPMPPTHAVTLEVDEFATESPKDSYPFTSYLNHLYVYPKCLKYETQKTFVKARNIACVVEFRDSDGLDAHPLTCIYGRPGEGLYNQKAICAVIHHSTMPDFFEEVKIELPAQLHDKHHILFTFLHVSCELAKGAKKKDQLVETPVGFSWFPILQDGRLNVEGQSVPVASHLPPGYLSCRNLGLGKGYSGPDIRWVEGQKPLFNFDLRLSSTVYAKDKHLHNFFAHVQKLAESKSGSSEAETCKNIKVTPQIAKAIKAMHAVDISALVNFLPTILNELFHLLVSCLSEEVSLNVIKVIIHIIHTIHDVGKTETLHSYVKFVFNTDSLGGNGKTSLHEELTKCLITTLRPANTDFLVINKFLRHSWFFFHTLIKSMAQHLLTTGKIKLYRHERFSSDYHFRIQGLLQGLMHHIVNKYKELPEETRQANRSLSYFMKKCLTFMDRGFVFKLINFYVDKFNLGDPKVLQEYKFEFLQIVMSHEHYISLNLPLLRGGIRKGQQRNIKDDADIIEDLEHEYHLSTEFCRNHFLVGILLQEVRVALNEVRDVRRIAVGVLRNLLAKHAFDDRYQNRAQQARIASLYLPVITIILENLNRINCAENPFCGFTVSGGGGDCSGSMSTLSSTMSGGLVSSSNPLSVIATPLTTPRLMSHRYTIGPDAMRASLLGEKHRRSSSFLTMISGQSGNSAQDVSTPEASLQSLNSSSSTLSASSQQDLCGESLKEHESRTRVDGLPSHNRSHSVPLNVVRHDKLVMTEVKDLLICFLYVLKNISEELLIGWWQHCSEHDILDFFQVLEICLHQFKYVGLKQIASNGRAPIQNGVAPKSMTLPARMGPPSFSNGNGRTMSSCSESVSIDNIVDPDCLYRALLEANMTTEVGLIVLDVLGLYLMNFKEQLLQNDGDNAQMKKVAKIYLVFLQIGQSEKLLKHLFAALRAFVNKFPAVFFLGSAKPCGQFCYEILKCCNSNLASTRNEACAILYLLMRSNYEFTGRRGLTRVHLQAIISVSQLLGDVIGSNCNRFQESLSSINNYANSDKAMQMTSFPSEVKDLTKRIRTVLMATMQMREHENDPEMLIDLQHSLANSYAATPELRKTWLESMSRIHKKNGDHSEAAFCYIHIAALVAEYLKQKGVYPGGCEAFANISSNIVHDESFIKEDSGMQDTHYTEETLLEMLNKSAELLESAERYELICDIFKISLPLYERQRDFESQAACYKSLYNACSKVIEVNRSGRRLLGKYYRVAFFGQVFFEEDAGKEYIYKEPKVTSLPEISERLYTLFCDKFGKDVVKMIMDSVNVEPKDLDPKYAFIQVTHVTPHFEESEADKRVTEFERNNNLRQFVFETPFTLSGKARGEPEEQYKRKTILKAIHAFPYIKKRIAVFSKRVIELSPIEVAIEGMENRVAELVDVINLEPPDFKKLQLKLQGSISVQVNAGPIAYANAFLEAKNRSKYSKDKVQDLKELFKNFLSVCARALELNGKLITSDQHEYHDAMKKNFQELASALSDMFQEKLLGEEKSSPGRNSLIFFNYISATPGSSTA